MKKLTTLIAILCFSTLWLNAQILITGKVLDSESEDSLPYASIAVPNSTTGTMTNASGDFELQLKEGQTQIQVSYVGYLDTLINIEEEIDLPAKISISVKLDPYSFGLTEIIVTSLTPLEYIQKALEKHPSLIPDKPFEARAFFASKSSNKNDDGSTYDLNQAVYKSYFSDYADDTLKENSQLLLYQNTNEGDFTSILMKNKRIRKAASKAKRDSISQDSTDSNGATISTDGNGVTFNINDLAGAGPSQAILESKSITELDFFDAEYFKKFKYSFGEQTYYKGRELIKINFYNKRKVEYSFYKGSIYLDYNDLSIVAVDYDEKAKIPFYINALLKTIAGFTIPELSKKTKIRNQLFDGKWYPKEVVYDLELSIKQKGELEVISTEVVLNIEEINIIDPSLIEEEKIFDENLEFEEQIYPIDGLEWKDVNIIKMGE